MSENMIQQEFYCSFEAAREGAVFARQLILSEENKRICKFPIDSGILVDTYWDIGKNDSTAIWFAQFQNNEFRLINYYEMNNEGMAHYAARAEAEADPVDPADRNRASRLRRSN